MERIRIASGGGTGPTELSAYDAALADAGVADYNLVGLSSVIPADARVEVVGTAPDLGPVGNRLAVVQGRAAGTGPAGAALAWARSPSGEGVFYEAGATGPDAVDRATEEATTGLDAGVAMREWSAGERDVVTARAIPGDDATGDRTTGADGPGYAAAVVVAAYGRSESLL